MAINMIEKNKAENRRKKVGFEKIMKEGRDWTIWR